MYTRWYESHRDALAKEAKLEAPPRRHNVRENCRDVDEDDRTATTNDDDRPADTILQQMFAAGRPLQFVSFTMTLSAGPSVRPSVSAAGAASTAPSVPRCDVTARSTDCPVSSRLADAPPGARLA